MPLSKRLTAEFIGTLWLVLGGCGSAVLGDESIRAWELVFAGSFPRVRSHGSNRSVRSGTYLGSTFQPGGLFRTVGWKTLSGE
jgi:hypothetical protein